MPQIPRAGRLDSTLAFLREGYDFGRNRFDQIGGDLFQTRLQLRRTIVLRGESAAELFYDESKFCRKGAMPRRVVKTLLGQGGVQGLDDAAHKARKHMLMSTLTRESVQRLTACVESAWEAALPAWERAGRVRLFEAMNPILMKGVCDWAGVPLRPGELPRVTRHVRAMIEGSGGVGPGFWRARLGRSRGNAWAKGVIRKVRSGDIAPPAGSPLETVATHRGSDGKLLDSLTAGVELLNLLRPTVAVGRFMVFAALALHEHPAERERVANDAAYRGLFSQEVRRFYPFFPVVAAVTRRSFEWHDYRFEEGTRVTLDLYATCNDPRLSDDPDAFRPARFVGRDISPYALIPQGGGDQFAGHRCAGEWATLALMNLALEFLTNRMSYDVPPQDLHVSRRRIPAIPRSRFVMNNVRRVAA